MDIRFLLLLVILLVGTGARVANKETTLAWSRAITNEDSLKRKQPQPLQRNQSQTINQAKPVWKRIGKVLLYVVIALVAIFMLVLFVVFALTSGMGK